MPTAPITTPANIQSAPVLVKMAANAAVSNGLVTAHK
jgi:hypothetical protein